MHLENSALIPLSWKRDQAVVSRFLTCSYENDNNVCILSYWVFFLLCSAEWYDLWVMLSIKLVHTHTHTHTSPWPHFGPPSRSHHSASLYKSVSSSPHPYFPSLLVFLPPFPFALKCEMRAQWVDYLRVERMSAKGLSQQNDLNRSVHLQIPKPNHLFHTPEKSAVTPRPSTGYWSESSQPSRQLESHHYSRTCIWLGTSDKDCKDCCINTPTYTCKISTKLSMHSYTHQQFHQGPIPFSNWFTLLTKNSNTRTQNDN